MLVGSHRDEAVDLMLGLRVVSQHEIYVQGYILTALRRTAVVDLLVQIGGLSEDHVVEVDRYVDRHDHRKDDSNAEEDTHICAVLTLRLFLFNLCHSSSPF